MTQPASRPATSHSLRVVCRPGSRAGFALAGVRAIGAVDGDEAAAVLRELVAQSEPGVIFVEESLHRALPETLREALERQVLPMVVPFPGPRAEPGPSAEEELVEMLRSAIGHRVRLR